MQGWVRGLAAAVACGLMAAAGGTATAERFSSTAANPAVFETAFTILREGQPIGEHRYRFALAGQTLTVTSTAKATVTLFGVPVYRFAQQVREEWQDGRLVALDAVTDDDGDRSQVSARATARGLVVDGPLGRGIAAPSAVPTTYWNIGTVRGAQLIDTRDGEIMNRAVTALGWERIPAQGGAVAAQRFRMVGRSTCDIWYDAKGLWRRAACDTEHGRIEDVRTTISGDPEHFARLLSAHYGGDERLAQGQPGR